MTIGNKEASDPPADIGPRRRSTRSKRGIRELLVVFDTNVLYTGSVSDLVNQEATSLISKSKFPDLNIQWYLPEVVRLERQFQMQKSALELLASIARVERLIGHNLNITEQILRSHVERVIAVRSKELSLIELKPDYANVDWNRLVLDAVFRRAPFQEGKNEKGFRDAVIVESFIHLIKSSPKTAKICRVVLVTRDHLITAAVRALLPGTANVDVLASLEELRGLINTLVSEVDELFLAAIRSKAEKLFFAKGDKSTIYYKERVRERLTEKFGPELAALPAGAISRKNGTWRLSAPNFAKKTGQRIEWTSRIQIETEATTQFRDESRAFATLSLPAAWQQNLAPPPATKMSQVLLKQSPEVSRFLNRMATPIGNRLFDTDVIAKGLSQLAFERSVPTHKGTDIYDVLWSVDVTKTHGLRRASVDDIVHVDAIWESIL
jgi:hypothetical protein